MSTSGKKIFVSNRLPFNIDPVTNQLHRGSGGLVSALLGVTLDEPFYWMGFETNAKIAKTIAERSSEIKSTLRCHPVLLSKAVYERYYDGVSNDVLWPLFHYETNLVLFDRQNWLSYKEANQTMADEILRIASPQDTVWIHDFHFLLLPKMLKEKNPDLKIGFFLHIPFPSAEIFRQIPVREEILSSLVHCDLLGFHEHSYLRHFTVSLKAQLGIDSTMFKAEIGEHTLHLGVYPISIDSESLKKKAASNEVDALCENYRRLNASSFQLVGVDRLDYTKGLELKLRGFQQALRKYPELVGRINLLQIAVPTRQKVPHYIKIKKDLDQLVGAINGEFSQPGYVPVQYIFNSVPEEALLAIYKCGDAALVTSKRDGMNLVAMEYVIAQSLEKPGVLILSEFAGAASLLGDALIINPWDADGMADAIKQAFHMPKEERRERMTSLQNILSKYSATKWAQGFLKDLEGIRKTKTAYHGVPISISRKMWPEDLSRKIRSGKRLRLVLDYDGTLVAFQKRPDLAILLEDTHDLLRALHKTMDVFVVSGRPKEFLDAQFKDSPFYLAAEHGAFYKFPGQKWRSLISSDFQTWYGEVERVMTAYTEKVPMSFIEKKAASLVWHFRESPPDFAQYQAKKLDDELQAGLANQPVNIIIGNKIVEAKANECNKGSFLRWLMQSTHRDSYLYICIGDDRTDEDMFKVLGPDGCSVKIGAGKTDAHYRIQNQSDVFAFVKEIMDVTIEETLAEQERLNHV